MFALALALARVAFLLGLYLLARVSSAALYPAVYANYPESIARGYLASKGWLPDESPDESTLRFYGTLFGVNIAFWLSVLLGA